VIILLGGPAGLSGTAPSSSPDSIRNRTARCADPAREVPDGVVAQGIVQLDVGSRPLPLGEREREQ